MSPALNLNVNPVVRTAVKPAGDGPARGLTGWMTGRLIGWLFGWVFGRLICRQTSLPRRWLTHGLLALGLAAASLAAPAETLIAGPDGSPLSLARALVLARDGDTIELLSGDYRNQPLVIEQRRLTLRGLGQRPVVHGSDEPGAQLALWTVRGGEVLVQNIEFRGARAKDASGAGLRLEGGALTVRDCVFYDNEHGILARHDADARLRIENTQFGLAPRVEGGLPHLLNVGRIARLDVTGSRFQQGFEGHMITSRARETFIGYNFLHDGTGGGSSYEIDLPMGGMATVIGNVIGQSPKSQNRVLVAYGNEGAAWERNALHLAHNTLINGMLTPAWFLRVFRDRLPAGTEVLAVNNLLVGPGLFRLGASGHFDGNRPALARMLADVDTYAFELPADSVWRGSGIDPRQVRGVDLSPKAEFTWPMGSRPLAPDRASWSPGAFQK